MVPVINEMKREEKERVDVAIDTDSWLLSFNFNCIANQLSATITYTYRLQYFFFSFNKKCNGAMVLSTLQPPRLERFFNKRFHVNVRVCRAREKSSS